jgi:hypothetical protein
MSGFCSEISQSRYCCFLGALRPLTFHISTVSGTLLKFRFACLPKVLPCTSGRLTVFKGAYPAEWLITVVDYYLEFIIRESN